MRHAMILAGGSGTRLWPMSREDEPKQLIPFLGGKSLLALALERLEGFLPPERVHICTGARYAGPIRRALPDVGEDRLILEPEGRDTLNAVALGAAVLGLDDPDAVIGVFTADHIIEPRDAFQTTIDHGFRLAEEHPETLVTFGIAPTVPSTAYGYLELGEALDAGAGAGAGAGARGNGGARVVQRFKEKPELPVATSYHEAGPDRYLWNSGLFVWRGSTLLDCVRRYAPECHEGLLRIARAWKTPRRAEVLAEVYPKLRKISIDFAVMEPASRDPLVRVAAVPMTIRWLDVGSWKSYGETCPQDAAGNAAGTPTSAFQRSKGCIVASSDPAHLVALLGCDDLVVIHTADATLVCPAGEADRLKDLHALVKERFGTKYL